MRNQSLLLLVICSCLSVIPQAQVAKHFSEKTTRYFLQNKFRVSVYAARSRKAMVEPNAQYHPGATGYISLGAGIDYCYHMNESWSLLTGLHGLWHGSDFHFAVSGNEFQPALGYDLVETGPTAGNMQQGLISLQSTLEKRWFTPKEKIWSTALGLALNYSGTTEHDFDYLVMHNGQFTSYASLFYDAQNNKHPFLSAHALAGRYWKLGKTGYLITRLRMDYSFVWFAKGNYSFHVPGKPEVKGEYKMDGTCYGLEIGYGFIKKQKNSIRLH